eukprot:12598798-Alexandrium_andersonii.AAC.1
MQHPMLLGPTTHLRESSSTPAAPGLSGPPQAIAPQAPPAALAWSSFGQMPVAHDEGLNPFLGVGSLPQRPPQAP